MTNHQINNQQGWKDAHSCSSSAKFIFFRLSILNFLEFAVFGSWFATLGLVLFSHGQASIIGPAYTLCAIAAIISPLFFGAIGDRWMSQAKLLGLLHVLGGAIQFLVPNLINEGHSIYLLLAIFAYMLLFQPTLGLVNAICFEQLKDKTANFPYLRTFSTLGWVMAAMGVGILGLSGSSNIFYITSGLSLVLGLYSFTLPKSSPIKVEESKSKKRAFWTLIGGNSLSLFKNRSFSTLMFCALLTSISLGFYNAYTSPFLGALGIDNVAGVLSLGQISEVVFILSVPFVITRIGMKYALFIGISMWGVRFVLFILASLGYSSYNAIVGVAMHGICNDFFLIVAAMYIDKLTSKDMKAQAQGWLIIMISGFGAAFGSLISGYLYSNNVVEGNLSTWVYVWFFPIIIAAITSTIWLIKFKEIRNIVNQ
ncbi:MFS transporter [Vibrio cholerae]|uniref:MFS transporter n=1 Tax=Vibrio cholerae TaxID=666 RepID=UPI001CA3104F|nr:MFS transporter [Vibrio cholerae]GHW45615.1 MFS transporter [Vibrio cholerae]